VNVSIDGPDQNPYAPPVSRDVALDREGADRKPKRRLLTWSVLYVLNLVVPLMFGFQCVNGALGVLGMFVGIGLFFVGTVVVLERRKWLYAPFCVGAAFLGLSQLWPVLQMFAGMLALTATEFVFGTPERTLHAFASSFATIITGSLLLIVAAVSGLVAYVLFNMARGKGVAGE